MEGDNTNGRESDDLHPQGEHKSIMIFEEQEEELTGLELYCDEEEEGDYLRRRRKHPLKHRFSPIAEVMEEGSTSKKPPIAKKYNYLEQVWPYINRQ